MLSILPTLSVTLLFTTQLLELEKKGISAFNIYDEAVKSGGLRLMENKHADSAWYPQPVVPGTSKTKLGIKLLDGYHHQLYEDRAANGKKVSLPWNLLKKDLLRLSEILSQDMKLKAGIQYPLAGH
jgi:Fe2+ transport system protein B